MCLHTSESAMPFPPAKLHAFLRRKMPATQPRLQIVGGAEGLFKFGFTTRREGICKTNWIKNDGTINPKLYLQ
jgi:hypothetical protein